MKDPGGTPIADARTSRAPGVQRYFFLHIMKTAGATLATQMSNHFASGHTYGIGAPGGEFLTNTFLYVNPRPLAFLPKERVDEVHFFGGHYPFAARSLMGDDVTTITILRDPVDRVISFLKHAQRFHPEHERLPLEEIYEDPAYFDRFLDNHEAKMFAMSPDEMLRHSDADGWVEEGWTLDQQQLLQRWREEPQHLTDQERIDFHDLVVGGLDTAAGIYRVLGAPNTVDVTVDDTRIRQAKTNLERVDVIGLVDEYDVFMRGLSGRLGIELDSSIRTNASQEQTVSKALRARIADRLGPSLELYDHARRLHDERLDR